MPKFTKDDIRGNQAYLKEWNDYQESKLKCEEYWHECPILLPVDVDINEQGELVRERISASAIESIYKNHRKELPNFLFKEKLFVHNPDGIFKDYIDYFGPQDNSQSGTPPTPLDLHCARPVWVLYRLKKKNWKFSRDRQYSVLNDRDDMRRNFEKICTVDDRNILILQNSCRSSPDGLKFNLHITIEQTLDGKVMRTPIIIDPDQDNDDGHTGYNN